MNLIFIRHAKALRRDKAVIRNVPDSDRPLTKKGILAFQEQIARHSKLFNDTDLFICSPFLRSEMTLDLLLNSLKLPLERKSVFKFIRPDDNPARFIKWLNAQKVKKIVAVSHEPYMSEFLRAINHQPIPSTIKKGMVLNIPFPPPKKSLS